MEEGQLLSKCGGQRGEAARKMRWRQVGRSVKAVSSCPEQEESAELRECKAQGRLSRFETSEDLVFRVLVPCEVDPVVKREGLCGWATRGYFAL